jgi:hypothetical protein
MRVTWYPKNIAIGLVMVALFALAIRLATDVMRGIAMGVVAALAYLFVDVLLSVNPALWVYVDVRLPRSNRSVRRGPLQVAHGPRRLTANSTPLMLHGRQVTFGHSDHKQAGS